jgi:hypothetical protein
MIFLLFFFFCLLELPWSIVAKSGVLVIFQLATSRSALIRTDFDVLPCVCCPQADNSRTTRSRHKFSTITWGSKIRFLNSSKLTYLFFIFFPFISVVKEAPERKKSCGWLTSSNYHDELASHWDNQSAWALFLSHKVSDNWRTDWMVNGPRL